MADLALEKTPPLGAENELGLCLLYLFYPEPSGSWRATTDL